MPTLRRDMESRAARSMSELFVLGLLSRRRDVPLVPVAARSLPVVALHGGRMTSKRIVNVDVGAKSSEVGANSSQEVEIPQDELIAQWEDFFDNNAYVPKIHAIVDQGEKSLCVRFGEIDRYVDLYGSDLADFLHRRPLNVITAGEEAIRRRVPPGNETPTKWVPLASTVTAATFTFRDADDTANFQRLEISLRTGTSATATRSSRQTDITFTALNTSLTTRGDTTECTELRAVP